MKNLNVFQVVIFAIFGLGAIIGLVVFASHNSSSHSSSDTVGSVVIWGTLPSDDVTGVLKLDQTLKSVTYVEKDASTLPADLASAIATGNSPDLVLASQEELLSLAPYLTPIPVATLSSRTFQSAFVGEANLLATSDGTGYYGVPYLVDPLELFFNTAILSSDGIVNPPSTWEGLTGLVPNVAVLTNTQAITRSLIALGTYPNVHDARGILSALFLQTNVPLSQYANGYRTANLGRSATTGIPPGQGVVSFYTQFADPSKVSYTWNSSEPDSQQSFLTGDSALYLGYASEATYFASANPNLNFNVAPLPQPATATTKNTYGLLYSFMISRGAKNPSGAYQTAAALTGSAEQLAASSASGMAPATRATLSTLPTSAILSTAYQSALYANGWLSPAPASVDSIFSRMITSVVTGASPINQSLATAESSLSAALQQ